MANVTMNGFKDGNEFIYKCITLKAFNLFMAPVHYMHSVYVCVCVVNDTKYFINSKKNKKKKKYKEKAYGSGLIVFNFIECIAVKMCTACKTHGIYILW